MYLKSRPCALAAAALIATSYATTAQAREVVLCNKLDRTFYIASFWKEGPLSCALRQTGCAINSSGWWELKPGQCHKPKTGLFRETNMVITYKDRDGKRQSAQLNVNNAVLSGRRYPGSSGVRNRNVCIKWGAFDRRVAGNWNAAFNRKCPTGYLSFPVSIYARATDRNREIVNLR